MRRNLTHAYARMVNVVFLDTLAEIVVVMQFCVVFIKIVLHGIKVIEFDMFEMFINSEPNSVGVRFV